MNRLIPIAGALALCCCASVAAQDSLENLAQELMDLRAEVERLNSELAIEQQEFRNEMASLAAQRTDLEANRNRLSLQLNQQRDALERNQQLAQEAGLESDELIPVLMSAVQTMRDWIAQSLPFKRDERLSELDSLVNQLEGGTIDAHRAVNRAWAFYEDEMRLTRENGIYSQTITLDGQEILADVAKLGAVMLFFKTSDMQYGYATQQGDNWRYVRLQSPVQEEAVATLFDSLQKQIRQGYFTIPNALGQVGG